MRLRRRRFLLRGLRKRRQMLPLSLNISEIRPDNILCFATIRNEAQRLPFFLEHYRRLGVAHFLIVDNGSDDGSTELLKAQPDVSLWWTDHSYKRARFGIDWMTGLMTRYGHGHWCLTVDADELFIYPHHDSRTLREFTRSLEKRDQVACPALMLELYPQGPLGDQTYRPGQDPLDILQWFDEDGYHRRYQGPLKNWMVQGGVRQRVFFQDAPERAPTLSKFPLVKWHWRYTYVSSTHSLLPPVLSMAGDPDHQECLSGVLLHTKFLPMVVERSAQEQRRQEHFSNSTAYDDYYDALAANPNLWTDNSTRYRGWRQLLDLGLMRSGDNTI